MVSNFVSRQMPISSYALLLANLIPLIGVIFFDWNSVLVLALFWIENLIIGAFNIVRIGAVSVVNKTLSGIGLVAFFLVHYGAFCSVHGILLADLLGYPDIETAQVLGLTSSGPQEIFLEGVAVLITFIRDLAPVIYIGLVGLFLSRLVSFIENFILGGEIFQQEPRQLMMQPYAQIFIMHAGLILGAIVLEKMGSPVWLLSVIVILKMLVDFKQFQRRHKKALAAKPVNRPANNI